MKNVFKSVLFALVLVLSAVFIAANPVVNTIPDQSVNEGSLLKISLSSVASAGALANFSVCQATAQPGVCSGQYNNKSITVGITTVNISTLSATTGELNWTPDFTQSGTYFFNITANASDLGSSKTFKVTVNDLPPKLTAPATLALGGETQERSDPNHDTQDRREVNISSSITLTNSGSEAINNIKGSVSVASGFSDSDVMINWSLPKTTLAVGESMTVPVTARIPQKLDAISKAFAALDVNVATLTFTATSANTGASVSSGTAITERAENNLRIKNIKVRYGDNTKSVDDRDKVEKMKAGQEVEIEIEVENKFSTKQDVSIEDITIRAQSDSQVDIDEEDEISSLGADDPDTVKFSAIIDEDADDGTYNVEITAIGTDEFGARHGEKNVIEFEVKRESHEIEIKSLTLNPPTVACELQSTLTANIRNSGRRDESEVYVSVSSPELKFGARSDELSLDKDDEDSVSFTIPVPEDAARPANYRITVDTYYNTGTKSLSDAAVLTLAQCKAPGQEEPPAEEKRPVVTPPVVTPPPVVQPKVNITVPPAKKPFVETSQYIALLVLGYVVVLVGGGLLLFKLFRKP